MAVRKLDSVIARAVLQNSTWHGSSKRRETRRRSRMEIRDVLDGMRCLKKNYLPASKENYFIIINFVKIVDRILGHDFK